MSELQNKILERLSAQGINLDLNSGYLRHKWLLAAALDLHCAAGGRLEDALELVQNYDSPPLDVATAVGNIIVETAVVSRAADLDMIQAAYNWIDRA
ncbi:hypothetical protein [Asticcacaulis sp.]|uniref:hypothetical protein n=1 Tax=Asticcacaulis sp. TaxID=1872648 RepID=UPI0026330718|nr:hypothetical protein [Asticcacaulis sp.]